MSTNNKKSVLHSGPTSGHLISFVLFILFFLFFVHSTKVFAGLESPISLVGTPSGTYKDKLWTTFIQADNSEVLVSREFIPDIDEAALPKEDKGTIRRLAALGINKRPEVYFLYLTKEEVKTMKESCEKYFKNKEKLKKLCF